MLWNNEVINIMNVMNIMNIMNTMNVMNVMNMIKVMNVMSIINLINVLNIMNIMKVMNFMSSKKSKCNHIFKSTRDHLIFEFFKLVCNVLPFFPSSQNHCHILYKLQSLWLTSSFEWVEWSSLGTQVSLASNILLLLYFKLIACTLFSALKNTGYIIFSRSKQVCFSQSE